MYLSCVKTLKIILLLSVSLNPDTSSRSEGIFFRVFSRIIFPFITCGCSLSTSPFISPLAPTSPIWDKLSGKSGFLVLLSRSALSKNKLLSFQEKEEILATVIDQVKGRVPVYAGTGCITTAETIRLSKRAEELGADALSIITPSFALASQKELYDHYTAVAKAVNLPIILYNIPAQTLRYSEIIKYFFR